MNLIVVRLVSGAPSSTAWLLCPRDTERFNARDGHQV
jgi:hypothetical protein